MIMAKISITTLKFKGAEVNLIENGKVVCAKNQSIICVEYYDEKRRELTIYGGKSLYAYNRVTEDYDYYGKEYFFHIIHIDENFKTAQIQQYSMYEDGGEDSGKWYEAKPYTAEIEKFVA